MKNNFKKVCFLILYATHLERHTCFLTVSPVAVVVSVGVSEMNSWKNQFSSIF
jgi:hypothetical protein